MGVSLSNLKQMQMKKSISDELAGQVEDMNEVSPLQTIGSIALPLLLTAAMGPLGTAMMGLGGGTGILGALGGAASTIGSGLAATGAATGGSAAGNLLNTLLQVGSKVGYGELSKKLTKEIVDKDKNPLDIKVTGGGFKQVLAKNAVEKLRNQLVTQNRLGEQTDLTGSILGAFAGQFGDDLIGGMKDIFTKTGGVPLANVDDAKAALEHANLMNQIGKDTLEFSPTGPTPLQELASGNTLMTEGNLSNLFSEPRTFADMFKTQLEGVAGSSAEGVDLSQYLNAYPQPTLGMGTGTASGIGSNTFLDKLIRR